MKQVHSLEEAQEMAALYALGALPEDEARDFEEHLGTACAVCAREVESFNAVVGDLAVGANPEVPGAHVRETIMRRLTAPTWEERGIHYVRGGQLDWLPAAAPSVERKPLFSDAGRGYHTQIVRMQPGAKYPRHRHSEVEEIYLIEGDLNLSGVTMHAGDYCRADAGSIHDDIYTQRGCVFLVLSSEQDELLA